MRHERETPRAGTLGAVNKGRPSQRHPLSPPISTIGQDAKAGGPLAVPLDYRPACKTGVPYHERRSEWQAVLTEWALAYARNGLPVFPVMPIRGQKKPMVRWGKGEDGHPNLTMRRATTDPVTILAWWAKWPLAMIGMPTGARSGLCVLDIDRKNGVDGFAELERLGHVIPSGAVKVVTPSGGMHVYFEASPDGPTKSSAGKIAPGVDVRGDGGFIIVPPSIPDIDGNHYTFLTTTGPEGQELVRGALAWLL